MAKRFTAAIILLLLCCTFVYAGPASPDIVDVVQPDGGIIKSRIRGDEFQSWIEIAGTGHTIIKNQGSGYWEYAEETKDGSLRGNGIHVLPNGLNAPASTKKVLRPPRNRELEKQLQQNLQEIYQQRLASAAVSQGGVQAAAGDWVPSPLAGSRNALIILVNFSNRTLTTTADSWNSTIFSTSPGALSVANYYKDNSFNNLTLSPVPHTQSGNPSGIITVTIAAAHPNSGSNFNYASETNILNLALAQAANHITFATYDTNGNGNLEQSELMVYFIYAGYEASGTSATPNIWAHAWGGSVTAGTKTISDWALNGELNNASVQHPMGVIAHELGHALCGLPDLYDISGNNEAMGNFSLMAGGSWGGDTGQYGGTTPTVLDAWSREFLGWAAPVVPTGSGTLSLDHALATTTSAYKLINPALSSTEYYLIENRQPTGWDRGLRGWFGSGWSGGLLITHIDTTAGTLDYNDINSYAVNATTPGHQGVVPVQASTAACNMLTVPATGCRGAVTTLFYAGNNATWTPTTLPSSNYYNGTSTLFSLTGISTPASTMTANLSLDLPVMRTVSITRSGSGSGTVTSAPAGIACGSSCSGSFQKDSTIVLTASPAAGSLFVGWSGGGCSGSGDCHLTIADDVTLNATFVPGITLWSQNFDSVTPEALPANWLSSIVTDTSTPNPSWYTNAGTRYPSGDPAHSSNNLVLFNSYDVKSGDSAMLRSPSFSLSGITDTQARFWLYRDNVQYGSPSTDDDRVEVFVNTSASLSGATLLGTAYRLTSMAPVVAGNGWYQFSYAIPGTFTGATNYLLFKGISGYGNDVHLDDISVAGSTSATTPAAPTAVSATPGNGQATVSFTLPASDGGSTILDYTATSAPGGLTATGTASPLSVTGLTNGTAYTFTVTARNAIGSSAPSTATDSITPITVPGAPTIGSATAGNQQVTVSFAAPSSDGGSAILDYTVTSSPGGLTATGTASPLSVTGLTNGTPYTFTVRARNAAGSGTASAVSNSATPNVAVKVGAAIYATISSAYGAIGDGDTIQLRDLTFSEAVDCNRAVAITLKGGYDSGFTVNSGATTISGSLTITSGSVTLENLIIS